MRSSLPGVVWERGRESVRVEGGEGGLSEVVVQR